MADWILPLCERWNRASSPWKHRQSIVGLIAANFRVLPFSTLIGFVDALLDDDDYYQKGIGWTLREIYNGSDSHLY